MANFPLVMICLAGGELFVSVGKPLYEGRQRITASSHLSGSMLQHYDYAMTNILSGKLKTTFDLVAHEYQRNPNSLVVIISSVSTSTVYCQSFANKDRKYVSLQQNLNNYGLTAKFSPHC